MIVDLHSHYPMHLLAGEGDTVGLMINAGRRGLWDKVRAAVLRLANHVANYPGRGASPAVTIPTLAASPVRVALSVLYAPFDEIDLGERYGATPQPRYCSDLMQQIALVEREVARQSTLATVAHNKVELAAAQAANKIALIHAVEGGFHLGDTPAMVSANVAALAARGVAYITVAHLFWRQVATNSPALPFLPDWLYNLLFPQPNKGLTPLGEAAITAMVANRVLIDVTHMSARAIDETLTLLNRLDPKGEVPLIATHSACRLSGGTRYSLSDEHIAAIVARNGVVGLIVCKHWMAKGMHEPKAFADSMDVICRHLERIRIVAKDPQGTHRFSAFGSDQDGFIKPALPGLDLPQGFAEVEVELGRRFGAAAAEQICSGNALRVLRYWS